MKYAHLPDIIAPKIISLKKKHHTHTHTHTHTHYKFFYSKVGQRRQQTHFQLTIEKTRGIKIRAVKKNKNPLKAGLGLKGLLAAAKAPKEDELPFTKELRKMLTAVRQDLVIHALVPNAPHHSAKSFTSSPTHNIIFVPTY